MLDRSTRTFIPLLLLGLLCGHGCGQSKPVVTGKVTYKTNPLTSGEVHFVGKNDTKPRSALIGPEGKYEIIDAPLGEVRIAVVSIKSAGPPAGPSVGGKGKKTAGGAGPSERRSAIPTRYNNHNTSAITLIVVPGTQSFDIELRD